ncbi:hypothetical protein [Hydromonas duriensis]|uniref:DUF202 domain-containing protein n=1 Tax=Hydromonas duriensis TaxID=1527608 RepID=A0A4R6Y9S9_9BURK|nr:hypothetical protein [Hydromonas duriensis]TDR32210.1 hypothetical protein DFR44_10597 [Hydromonas duriensis]
MHNSKNMNHDIKDFRQPMVTSLGIIMGFALGFMGNWATEDDGGVTLKGTADWLTAGGLFLGVILMIVTLYRLLNNRYDQENVGMYYHRTFQIYILALVLTFTGLMTAIFFY